MRRLTHALGINKLKRIGFSALVSEMVRQAATMAPLWRVPFLAESKGSLVALHANLATLGTLRLNSIIIAANPIQLSPAMHSGKTGPCFKANAGRVATALPAARYAASASSPFSSTPCCRSGLFPDSLRIST